MKRCMLKKRHIVEINLGSLINQVIALGLADQWSGIILGVKAKQPA